MSDRPMSYELEAWIRRSKRKAETCSQCGQRWKTRACGPTHAILAANASLRPLRYPTIGESE